jgi:hypothetical protein
VLYIKKNYKIILLLSILIIVFYRSPHIFLHGRFAAEEGAFFFRNSFLYGPLKGLLYVYDGSPYFNFWANLSSVLASYFPLEYSPLVTVYMAFLVQLYLFVFIIFSESNFLTGFKDKVIISLLVLIAPPMVASVWLNTLTSQVYFTILTILIFFQKEIRENFFSKISPLLIFIAGLTSILPCVLLPFFGYKYFKNKNRFNYFNFISLSIPTLVQFVLYIYVKISNLESLLDGPRYILSVNKLINYFYNSVVKSFLGRDLTQKIYFDYIDNQYKLIITFIILILLIFFLKKIFNKLVSDKTSLYLLIFFLIQSILAIYAAKFEEVQGRYALIPGILLIFLVYRMYQITYRWQKGIFVILISLSLLSGAYEFKENNKYPQFLACIEDCPNWKDEVKKWRKDNNYELKIWYYPKWTMNLN